MVLDVRGVTTFADYFVICTGANARQIQTIAQEIEQQLKLRGEYPASVEGYRNAEWVLVDYGDLLVHIFSQKARLYYDLGTAMARRQAGFLVIPSPATRAMRGYARRDACRATHTAPGCFRVRQSDFRMPERAPPIRLLDRAQQPHPAVVQRLQHVERGLDRRRRNIRKLRPRRFVIRFDDGLILGQREFEAVLYAFMWLSGTWWTTWRTVQPPSRYGVSS